MQAWTHAFQMTCALPDLRPCKQARVKKRVILSFNVGWASIIVPLTRLKSVNRVYLIDGLSNYVCKWLQM